MVAATEQRAGAMLAVDQRILEAQCKQPQKPPTWVLAWEENPPGWGRGESRRGTHTPGNRASAALDGFIIYKLPSSLCSV